MAALARNRRRHHFGKAYILHGCATTTIFLERPIVHVCAAAIILGRHIFNGCVI